MIEKLVGSLAIAAFAAGPAFAAPVVIEDFTDNGDDSPSFGMFTFGAPPGGSGSNAGASSGSTGVGVGDFFPFSPAVSHYNSLSVGDDGLFGGTLWFGTTTAWNFRHVANGGSPAAINTISLTGGNGWFGFYLRTTATDLWVGPALDETGGSGGTELGTRTEVIADGEWHLYQWNLGDDTQWEAFFGASNGAMDGTAYTLDSINFWSTAAESSTVSEFDLAYLTYDADGPLVNLVPEPGSLALLGLGGLAVLRRRRA
jgi:hypothetical protein